MSVTVDDGEVRAEREGDSWRLYVQTNPEGDEVSHLLSRQDAQALSDALQPRRPGLRLPELSIKGVELVMLIVWFFASGYLLGRLT